ncbi:MAG: arginase family protein [Thermoproteota archaeon]|nr:arginase family protein [Thermoproteota archaeon]
MIRFSCSSVSETSEAEIVIIGVPDESLSHAKRRGTSKAPDILRNKFNESNYFYRNGNAIPVCPMSGNAFGRKIMDYGNITREDVYRLISSIALNKKIPIVIGGDHSITSLALRALGEVYGKMGLFYFDAHPDFVSSTTNYYGSVLTDSCNWIDFGKSMLIGTRSAEPEELDNAQKSSLEIVTPIDIRETGLAKVAERIKSKHNNGVKYVSIDLDCLDPAFAPGVSVPSPCGLSSLDLVYLVKLAISSGIVGIDIVEFSPDFDVNDVTANLVGRILLESIASIGKNTPMTF